MTPPTPSRKAPAYPGYDGDRARAALLLSALADCAVVFIRYTLAHLGVAPDVY